MPRYLTASRSIGDQMRLGATGAEFVDDVNVKHGLQVYVGQKFGISGVGKLPQAAQINGDANGDFHCETAMRAYADERWIQLRSAKRLHP